MSITFIQELPPRSLDTIPDNNSSDEMLMARHQAFSTYRKCGKEAANEAILSRRNKEGISDPQCIGVDTELRFYVEYREKLRLVPALDCGDHVDFVGERNGKLILIDVTTNLQYKNPSDYEDDENHFVAVWDIQKVRWSFFHALGNKFVPCHSMTFDEDEISPDENGFEKTAKLMQAYTDIDNNRQMIANNWPHSNLDPSTRIMRFTTLDRLKSMLRTRTNFLAPVLKWKDVYEGLTRNIKLRDQNNRSIDWSLISSSFFGQCWTTTQFDSELLWNARCPDLNKVGICIRSTFGKLVKSFLRHFCLEALESGNVARCGSVVYQNDASIINLMHNLRESIRDSNGMTLRDSVLLDYLMAKRESFQDENEIRLILDGSILSGTPVEYFNNRALFPCVAGVSYLVAPTDFLDEIIIDPRLSPEAASKVIGEVIADVAQYGWMSGKKALPVCQSKLYQLKSEDAITVFIPVINGMELSRKQMK